MNKFGINLRRLRTARDLSQYALANELGVAQTHIAGLETGRVRPSWPFAQKVAEYFGITLNDLNADIEPEAQPEPATA